MYRRKSCFFLTLIQTSIFAFASFGVFFGILDISQEQNFVSIIAFEILCKIERNNRHLLRYGNLETVGPCSMSFFVVLASISRSKNDFYSHVLHSLISCSQRNSPPSQYESLGNRMGRFCVKCGRAHAQEMAPKLVADY